MRTAFGNGVFHWGEIPWSLLDLKAVQYRNREDVEKKRPKKAGPFRDDGPECVRLAPYNDLGKITDAGYDRGRFLFFALPADRDLTFRAVIRIRSFPGRERATGQEGCGLFLRDTMELDRKTGYPYSDMLTAGACFAGWNCFLRTGVDRSVGRILNEVFPPEGMTGYPEEGSEAEIVLVREGGTVRAGIRVPGEGDDVLTERSVPADAWRARDRRFLYAGFLVTGGCEIEIPKDSVILEVRPGTERLSLFGRSSFAGKTGKRKSPRAGTAVTAPAVMHAAPEGRPDAAGTPEDPVDIQTAAARCGAGGTVLLAPGVYRPQGSVTLDRTKLLCAGPEGSWAVLDFGGRQEGLDVLGDGAEVRGIAVTRGLGFRVRGSRNRIVRCAAAYNLETGFLIRLEDNDAPTWEWPSGNVVEDCVSFCNADPSEHNADGFAAKVTAGRGNVFRRCTAFLNSDDGFDLFAKNRPTGAALLEDCEAFMNGFSFEDGELIPTKGNGNGFKLGGSGQRAAHRVLRCEAVGNRESGFTSNSNPWMDLEDCRAGNNPEGNYLFYFTSPNVRTRDRRLGCAETDVPDFDPAAWLKAKTEEIGHRIPEQLRLHADRK